MLYIHIIYQSRVTAARTSNGWQIFVKNCNFQAGVPWKPYSIWPHAFHVWQ